MTQTGANNLTHTFCGCGAVLTCSEAIDDGTGYGWCKHGEDPPEPVFVGEVGWHECVRSKP